MWSMRYAEFGDAPLVREEIEQLQPSAGEVLVRVAATSFNPVDAAIRSGAFGQQELPMAPGLDLSGVVESVGEGVSGWGPGDAVVAYLPISPNGGAAEFVTVDADRLAPAPTTVPLADAAALPLVGVTAWQEVHDHGGLQPGQRVLVNGGGTATGAYVVQFAHNLGAHVTATASARTADRLRRYGAEEVIDYHETPLADIDGEFDVIFNQVRTNADQTLALVGLLAEEGTYVSITTAPPDGVKGVIFSAHSDGDQLADLVTLVDAGEVEVYVSDRRPVAELDDVFAEYAAGRLNGKTVIVAS